MELRLKWCIALELMAYLHQEEMKKHSMQLPYNMRAMELGKHLADLYMVDQSTASNTVAIAQIMAGQSANESATQESETSPDTLI